MLDLDLVNVVYIFVKIYPSLVGISCSAMDHVYNLNKIPKFNFVVHANNNRAPQWKRFCDTTKPIIIVYIYGFHPEPAFAIISNANTEVMRGVALFVHEWEWNWKRS